MFSPDGTLFCVFSLSTTKFRDNIDEKPLSLGIPSLDSIFKKTSGAFQLDTFARFLLIKTKFPDFDVPLNSK
jgi:hypothetical protein